MKKLYIMIFILFILVGCKKTEEITMIVPFGSPQLAQLYMQESKDYNVDIVQGADPLVAAFGSGSHDVIFAPTNLGAKLYQSRQTYQLLATIVWGNYYFVTQKQDITNIQDLDGEEIVVFGQNQTSDIIIKYLIDFYDITCQITYVDSVATASSLFIVDTNQIVLVAEPSYANLKHLFPSLKTIDIQAYYQAATSNASMPQASVFVKSTLTDIQIEKIQNDLHESIEKTKQNPMEAAQLAVSLGVNIDVNILQNSISSGYLEYVSAQDAMSDIMIYFEMIMDHNSQLIGSQLPDASFYRGDLG
jgi:NitT/TauT family transport system substrate-binding protein